MVPDFLVAVPFFIYVIYNLRIYNVLFIYNCAIVLFVTTTLNVFFYNDLMMENVKHLSSQIVRDSSALSLCRDDSNAVFVFVFVLVYFAIFEVAKSGLFFNPIIYFYQNYTFFSVLCLLGSIRAYAEQYTRICRAVYARMPRGRQ